MIRLLAGSKKVAMCRPSWSEPHEAFSQKARIGVDLWR